MPNQNLDVQLWKQLKNALRFALSGRNLALPDEEISLVLRFMLEKMEAGGLRLVPTKATTEMHIAMQHALDEGKRQSVAWVQSKTKQRWRYQAALDAAPNWRIGYDKEREVERE